MKSTTGTALRTLAGVAVLGLIVPVVLAHGGDEGMDMGEGHGHGQDSPKPSEDSYPTTYFSLQEHSGVLYTHIVLMVVSWVIMLPIVVMFSLARSRYTVFSQIVFGVTNAAGVLFGVIYNSNTPDLYPGNAHHKLGWVVTWVSCSQVAVGMLARLVGAFKTSRSKKQTRRLAGERQSFIPVSTEAMAEHQRTNGKPNRGPYRLSNDSGQGTEPRTESLRSPSSSSSSHDEEAAIPLRSATRKEYRVEGDDGVESEDEIDYLDGHVGGIRSAGLPLPAVLKRGGRVQQLAQKAADLLSSRAWRVLIFGYDFVDRVILILGFMTICTGVVTMGRFFEDREVFSGLAHWIKGGVFFWMGLFTLGRWTGAFGELGWAWNVRPRHAGDNRWRPSAEFMESFLIFFYGSTNIFLEHLGNSNGAWSPQDLEHVSITVLFIGGGLCGMLIESTAVRDLLNTTAAEAAHDAYPADRSSGNETATTTHHSFHGQAATEQRVHDEEGEELLQPPRQYGVSLNPFPALVILLLGIMMSSHTQRNMVSSMVHKQWGNLLMGGAFARGFSYVLMYLKPPRSVLPSRPPTELLAAFGLCSGGIIFMASSSDTVAGMIHLDMDAMFMYTVTMGLVALLMAWTIIVLAIKGWAVRREAGR